MFVLRWCHLVLKETTVIIILGRHKKYWRSFWWKQTTFGVKFLDWFFKGPAPQTPSWTKTHVPSRLDTICRVSPWIINMNIICWGSCPLVGKEIVNKSVVVVSVTSETSKSVIQKKPHLGAGASWLVGALLARRGSKRERDMGPWGLQR